MMPFKAECGMAADAKRCYDDLADHYHLIFENWDASMARQAEALRLILERECGPVGTFRVLDCACGIGTQALGLAKLGFKSDSKRLQPSRRGKGTGRSSAEGAGCSFAHC